VDEASEPGGAGGAIAVPGGTRQRAEEWALVLASQGIATRIEPGMQGYVLAVPSGEATRARSVLDAYVRENAERAADAAAAGQEEPLGEPGLAGVWVALLLLACHWLAGRAALHDIVYAQGSADAHAILAGEWWRTVTALFLHAGLGHVVGNALFGVYFVSAVTRSLGSGLGLALVLASGAIGNALNALAHPHGHDSIGASTAVFGAIGILAGMALARRSRAGLRGTRLLLPVGAGLGLLAMLGTSGARVDIFAHLYGVLAGGVLGLITRIAVTGRPGTATQLVLGTATAAVVGLCFTLVWQA